MKGEDRPALDLEDALTALAAYIITLTPLEEVVDEGVLAAECLEGQRAEFNPKAEAGFEAPDR